MTRRLFSDPFSPSEIDHSRRRIERSRSMIDASRSVIDASSEAIRASLARMQSLSVRSIDATEQPIAANPLAEMDDETIHQIVADLTVAYTEACETGDEGGVEAIGNALKVIGRYLAVALGPKAAGAPMN